MNIFYLADDPILSAQQLCDKHIVKMPVECGQMLSTALLIRMGHDVYTYYSDLLYKPTHASHPCTLWAASTFDNMDWLLNHGLALCDEYTYRYGKEHATRHVLNIIEHIISLEHLFGHYVNRTKPVLAMPDGYKNEADPILSYRMYYIEEKHKIARYTRRQKPLWLSIEDPYHDLPHNRRFK